MCDWWMPPAAPATRAFHRLVERRVVSRHVEEARAETERAVAHAGTDQVAHPLQFLRHRDAVGLAHDRAADRAVADEGADVDRGLGGLDFAR